MAENQRGSSGVPAGRKPNNVGRGSERNGQRPNGAGQRPERRRKKRGKLSSLWHSSAQFRIIATVLSAVIVCAVGYEVVDLINDPMETLTACEETVRETIDIKFFAVRDEEYLTNSASGTHAAFITEGARAAKGETVAAVFNSAEDAERYLEAKEISADIKRYNELNSFTYAAGIDVERLGDEMDALFMKYLETVSSGLVDNAPAVLEDFRDKATSREIVVSGSVDFSSRISELQNSLAAIAPDEIIRKELTAPEAGYYITSTDGYEDTLGFDNIDALSAENIETALKSKARSISADVKGRMIYSYNWYLACVLDKKNVEQANITEGDSFTVQLPYSEETREIKVKVRKINTDSNGKSAVIFSSNTVDNNILSLRIEDARLIYSEHVGYKVPDSAIREVKNEKTGEKEQGVFIVTGNVTSFRKLDTIYVGDGFVVSAKTQSGSSGYVSLYDEIITSSGKGLYDGKVIR